MDGQMGTIGRTGERYAKQRFWARSADSVARLKQLLRYECRHVVV